MEYSERSYISPLTPLQKHCCRNCKSATETVTCIIAAEISINIPEIETTTSEFAYIEQFLSTA